jgi:uncharacterized repeat protein (TIGR03803 family)
LILSPHESMKKTSTIQITCCPSLVVVIALLSAAVPVAEAQTFTSLHSFGVADGGNVQSGLVQGGDGSLYGMTSFGGASYEGTVYKISPGSGYSFTVLRSFSGGVGYGAGDGLVQGKDGNFYGVSPFSGSPTTNGVIFRINPVGPSYTFTLLHSFNGSDGRFPIGRLVQGSDGNFYGTTVYGGTNGDRGTVFRISPVGPNYDLAVLHCFSGSDGQNPIAGLVQGGDGNFYGSTEWGGGNGWGTIFRISPAAPNFTLTILHSFTGADGETPDGELVQGSDGDFYGTTPWGGLYGQGNGDGTVFRISPIGPDYTLTSLHSFSGPDGLYPNGLVQGSDGNFYGTTYQGGASGGYGTVFQISPAGPDYTLASLHTFGGSDGENPNVTVVQAADGSFYGTTFGGGTNGGYGTVFKISIPLANPPSPVNRITGVQFQAGNALLSIDSIAGETYQLQFSSSLAPANWSNLIGAAITNSIGGAITITNSGVANAAQGYYRLEITR